jgi:hypothetical protein
VSSCPPRNVDEAGRPSIAKSGNSLPGTLDSPVVEDVYPKQKSVKEFESAATHWLYFSQRLVDSACFSAADVRGTVKRGGSWIAS